MGSLTADTHSSVGANFAGGKQPLSVTDWCEKSWDEAAAAAKGWRVRERCQEATFRRDAR